MLLEHYMKIVVEAVRIILTTEIKQHVRVIAPPPSSAAVRLTTHSNAPNAASMKTHSRVWLTYVYHLKDSINSVSTRVVMELGVVAATMQRLIPRRCIVRVSQGGDLGPPTLHDKCSLNTALPVLRNVYVQQFRGKPFMVNFVRVYEFCYI